jgi:hypothetical protein
MCIKSQKLQNVGMQTLGFSVCIYKDMAMITLVTWKNNFTTTSLTHIAINFS